MNELAKRIIVENSFITLATVTTNGYPHSTPVYYCYDDEFVFYWYSGKDTKHSQNIANNHNVFATIFGVGTSDEGKGVYIEGKASELTKVELPHALSIYAKRSAKTEESLKQHTTVEDFLNDSPLRLYKLVPNKIWVSNAPVVWRGKWIDSKSEVEL